MYLETMSPAFFPRSLNLLSRQVHERLTFQGSPPANWVYLTLIKRSSDGWDWLISSKVEWRKKDNVNSDIIEKIVDDFNTERQGCGQLDPRPFER